MVAPCRGRTTPPPWFSPLLGDVRAADTPDFHHGEHREPRRCTESHHRRLCIPLARPSRLADDRNAFLNSNALAPEALACASNVMTAGGDGVWCTAARMAGHNREPS